MSLYLLWRSHDVRMYACIFVRNACFWMRKLVLRVCAQAGTSSSRRCFASLWLVVKCVRECIVCKLQDLLLLVREGACEVA